ncbi:MAG: hypothetical protein FWF03_02280 [Defluviitaleaceae bacterium]|nr:hypothetical protein [Defluviitaleaceae bacterium]
MNNGKHNKGAASVLVIFMLLVLVTLGAFAISAANANYKLSRRAINWNEMYYGLDAKAEEMLALIDGMLAEAERDAIDYVVNEGWQNDGYEIEIKNRLTEESLANRNVTDIFNQAYLYYSNLILTKMSLDKLNVNVYNADIGKSVKFLSAWVSILSDHPGFENSSLEVSLMIGPAARAAENGRTLEAIWERGTRYVIKDWYEYQPPPGAEAPMPGVWDGTFSFDFDDFDDYDWGDFDFGFDEFEMDYDYELEFEFDE